MQPCLSYLVCATPRSGSTLLCEALINSGLAGQPKEYFQALKKTGHPRRPQDYFEPPLQTEIIKLLGDYSRLDDEPVEAALKDAASYAAYIEKVKREGTTPNNVFGAKVMWGYFEGLINNLQQIPEYKKLEVSDLLSRVFPNLRYIQVTRQDKVRQAISLWKAIQTWTWKDGEPPKLKDGSVREPKKLYFHYDAIDHLQQHLKEDEIGWKGFFDTWNITPIVILYEELATAYEATALQILHYLDIPIPETLVFAERRMRPQADTLSEEWTQQYYATKREREGNA